MTDAAPALPVSGALTFLFTDIEGSTRKAHELGDAWFDVLEAHHGLLRPVFAAHGGVEVSTAGDSFFVVFQDAASAVAATVAMQRAIAAYDWSPHPPVRVRMGLHTGPARFRAHDNDYAGLTVHAASRVESAAAGAQVLITQATLDAAAATWPASVDYIDLGFHRLKDLPSELHLYQLVADGLAREFPPVRGLEVARNNVPVPPSTFIGRTEVLTRLHHLLDDDRLVTVVGSGGTGKTRVALRLASERLPRHADGVWFVELATARDHAGVIAAVGAALGVKERVDTTMLEAVLEHVRARQLLLVVDNCEQVVDAAAAVIDKLLAAGGGVRVLATSREPLEIEGERVWPLAPLSTDDDDGNEAVALLVDRIEGADPDFVLTDDLRAAALDVVRRLDGLPLALELAAASAATMTLPELAAHIDARFELLVRGKRTAAERQKTLWGAIEWSYGLLSADEQLVFRRLGVFPGDFDFGVVAAVCGGGVAVDDVLLALQRKSLLRESPSTRLRLLESIRAYAHDQLVAHAELSAIAERHARHFAAESAAASSDWIDAIHEDLLAARRWGVDHDADVELAATLALQPFWIRKGRLHEGRALSDQTLARTDGVVNDARVRLAGNTGQMALLHGDATGARALFNSAAEIAGTLGGAEYRAVCLGDLGEVAFREGDFDTASALFTEALASGRRAERVAVVATSLAHLAQIAAAQGDLARAWDLGLEATDAARGVDTHREVLDAVEFSVQNLLGVIAWQRGHLTDARQVFADALAHARKFDLVAHQPYLLFCVASVELASGDAPAAVAPLREALPLALRIGAPADLAESLEAAAHFAVQVDRAEVGAVLLASANALRDRIGFARDAAGRAAYDDLCRRVEPTAPTTPEEAVAIALDLFAAVSG